ncbi:hypothetical protein GJ496_010982 [Pomphorhynchus laevis]|nr:hypothetical protein GJ496_010982 [Pomphorhynchus laevis]
MCNINLQEMFHFELYSGWDLLMYNTYDVLFYASPAFIQLWPNIQLSMQYDFAKLISQEDIRIRKFLFSRRSQSKILYRIPHDIGEPCKLFRSYKYNSHSSDPMSNTLLVISNTF